jgi:hypothetical protein
VTDGGFDRREFLGVLAALGVAGAGCLSTGDDDTPRYADLVPAIDDGVAYSYLDFRVTEESGSDGSEFLPILLPSPSGGDEQPVQLPDDVFSRRGDPLLSLPAQLGSRILVGGVLAFSTAGLGDYVQRGNPETVEELFVGVGESPGAGGTLATGEFDIDKLDQQLRTEGDRGFAPVYEFVDESGGFRFYNVAESGSSQSPSVIAVSGERIALGRSRDGVEQLIDTANGDREGAVDAAEGFDRLTEQVGDGSIALGWHGSIDPMELLGDTDQFPETFSPDDNVAVVVDLSPETDEIGVKLAVHSDSLSATRRDSLETTFDTSDVEITVSPDAGRFSASGTYSDISFEPVGSDWTDDLPSGDNLPPKIEEAVPEDPVEISPAPDQEDVYRLETTGELRVDELTVRTINADREITLDSPNTFRWVSLYPDPEGDEIRVVATVDDVSGIIATKRVP